MTSVPFQSEDDFIAHFLAPLAADAPGALGLKDDAAWITPPPGHDLVVTTDTLVEGVHFLFDGSADEARSIALKAIAVNVSDLAAKAATPVAYLLALTLPVARPAATWFSGFATGLQEAQQRWGLRLLGGDTTRHSAGLAITITALGTVASGRMVKRSGARPGDQIFVSGTIGDAVPGLALRRGGDAAAAITSKLNPTEKAFLLGRYQRPEPRLALAPILAAHASAAMDVSDGLALDLSRLMAASGAGATISMGKVPISVSLRRLLEAGIVSHETLITGGDDYEILATVPVNASAAFESDAGNAGISVTNIGMVRAAPGVDNLDSDGQRLELTRLGYDHFSGK